jgi:hypothetical protein
MISPIGFNFKSLYLSFEAMNFILFYLYSRPPLLLHYYNFFCLIAAYFYYLNFFCLIAAYFYYLNFFCLIAAYFYYLNFFCLMFAVYLYFSYYLMPFSYLVIYSETAITICFQFSHTFIFITFT